MERTSRLLLIGSILLAGVVHAWLASGRPGLVPAAAVAFVITFLIARVSLVAALVPVLAATYLAPALTLIAFGASDYHTTLLWLAAIAGPVLSQADLSRWHIPGRWRLPFAAWALVIAVSWPVVAGRELDFSLVAARTYDTMNGAFEAPPRLAAAWILIVALSQMIGILWLDMLWARFAGLNLAKAERFVILPLVVSAAIGALAGLYQALVDVEWLNLFYWSRNERAGGLMLDANTFGIGAAMWAPAAMALTWRFGRGGWRGGVVFLPLAAAVWFSGSRTALLALTIGSAGLIVAIAQRLRMWQPRMAPIALLLGATLLVLASAVVPRTEVGGPLKRVVDRLPRLEAGDMRRFADEMWNRFGYGQAAASMIAEHPLTGVGIGAFHIVGTDYLYRAADSKYRQTAARPFADNAQNWWRHQIAELGLAGALPSLWISVLVVGLLWRGGLHVEPVGVTTILRTVLIGVGVASLVGVPTQHPASWVSFVTILFWLTALCGQEAIAGATSGGRRMWMGAFAVAGLTAVGLGLTAANHLRVPLRALRTGLPYSYGVAPPEGLSEYGELRWTASRAVAVVAVPNRWLKLTFWAPHLDVGSNPVTLRVGLNRRGVIEHSLSSHEPVTYYLEMPENARWALIEVSASREIRPDRALQVATAWLRELPRDASPEQVVR